jgi:crossover junction endodeoxyribonuclease RuvC
MIIVGLDLSLTATGLVASDSPTPKLIKLIKTKMKGEDRLDFIDQSVMGYCMDADVVVMEGYSFGARGNAVFQIGELGGVIRLSLRRAKIPFALVPPSNLKKYATGKGNVGKDEVIAAAIRRFGFPGHDNNEADAHILWKMGVRHYTGVGEDLPQTHLDALTKIEWPEVLVHA